MSTPQIPGGLRGRAPILIVVVVAIGVGLFAGRAHSPRSARVASPVDAVQRSNPGALSTAWYCPGLPSSFRTRDQAITLSNVGSADADAAITVHPDGGAGPIVRRVTVPANTVRSFDRGSLLETSRAQVTVDGTPVAVTTTTRPGAKSRGSLPAGSVVVEPFSPDVVVSAGVETDTALDSVPCATTASAHWYFAAGETVRGVKQWLVLQNPFSADARVNVILRTDVGLKELENLQGIDVAGRSRVVVPIHEQAVRQPRVAIEVQAVVGQVVAAQTLEYSAAAGTPGVATTLGALAQAPRWWFTDGDAREGAAQWVAVTDLSPLDAPFVVQAFVDAKTIVTPVPSKVTSGGVTWVQIGDCARGASNCLQVPAGANYELSVQTDGRVPIVAQTLSRFRARNVAVGATTSMGSTQPVQRWVIARSRVASERETSISVMNPDARSDARVSVEVVHDGVVDRPADLQHMTLTHYSRVVLPPETVGVTHQHDAAVVITADIPIYAASTIYVAKDATRPSGIPTR